MALATYAEAFKEYARNAGQEAPEQAWILTPWDTWERNPAYSGPPQRHPEDEYSDDEDYAERPEPTPPEGWGDWADDEIPF